MQSQFAMTEIIDIWIIDFDSFFALPDISYRSAPLCFTRPISRALLSALHKYEKYQIVFDMDFCIKCAGLCVAASLFTQDIIFICFSRTSNKFIQ